MELGKRIYFDKLTCNVIAEKSEMQGDVIATTVTQDIATFKALSERNRTTFDVIELPYGTHKQDFSQCSGYRVNPSTRAIEFSYPNPNEPTGTTCFRETINRTNSGIKRPRRIIRIGNRLSNNGRNVSWQVI
jgi:hypothetical protein